MKILRLPDVLSCTGITRPTLYRYISRGQFPRQIHLGPRATGWLETEVHAWIAQRAAARPQQHQSGAEGGAA